MIKKLIICSTAILFLVLLGVIIYGWHLSGKIDKRFASRRWSMIEPLIADEACVIFSEGTYNGKGEIQKAFEQTFTLINDEYYEIEFIKYMYNMELKYQYIVILINDKCKIESDNSVVNIFV